GEVGRDVAHAVRERLPDVVAELVPRVRLDRLLHLRPPLVVGRLRPRHPDDRELLRQQPPVGERVERRNQLALRQVAGCPEDDHRARLRLPAEPEPLEKRVLLLRRALGRDRHSVLTAWPPNWFRSAALTLAANDSSCRDAKRANSAAVIT